MMGFAFNSSCVPVTTQEYAISKSKEIFGALLNYVGIQEYPVLHFDKELENIFIFSNYSLINFLDDLNSSDRDFSDVLTDFLDKRKILDCENLAYDKLKIGDDSRFNDCNIIKHACKNDFVLFSITDDKFWQRKELHCFIYRDKNCSEYNLLNLFSAKTDYLPIDEPPFSIKDKKRFENTGKFFKGAPIYREKSTGYFWYKDTFHIGSSAHYEIFNSNGTYIGEANMKGQVDKTKADVGKHLKEVL